MRALTLLAALCLALLSAGCGKTETVTLLPWFKIKITRYPSLGGFSDGHSVSVSYMKRWGFWSKLENCSGGDIVNDEVVSLACGDGSHWGRALVRKGGRPRPACGTYAMEPVILPSKRAVDCFEVLAGRAPVCPTAIGMKRMSLDAEVIAESSFQAEGGGRVFSGPIPRFYDSDDTPYFVTHIDDDFRAPQCALFTLERGALKRLALSPELTWAQCSEARPWSRITGLALKDSLGREEPPEVPSTPQKLRVIVR